MAAHSGPDIIQDGLVLSLDAANTKSYPGSGNTWFGLDKNKNDVPKGSFYVPTFSNNAFTFVGSGSNRFFQAPDPGVGNIFTIEGVFKSTSSSNSNGIFLTPASNGFDNFLRVRATSGLNDFCFFYCQSTDTNNTQIKSAEDSVITNQWHHYTVTMNQNTTNMWFDGEHVASSTESFTIGSWTGVWRIGVRYSGYSADFAGEIPLVKVYNRVLTDSEIKQNFDAIRDRFGL